MTPPKPKVLRGALRAPRISFVFPLYFANLSGSLQIPMGMKRFHFSTFHENPPFRIASNPNGNQAFPLFNVSRKSNLSELLQFPMKMKRFHFSTFREIPTFQNRFNPQWKWSVSTVHVSRKSILSESNWFPMEMKRFHSFTFWIPQNVGDGNASFPLGFVAILKGMRNTKEIRGARSAPRKTFGFGGVIL